MRYILKNDRTIRKKDIEFLLTGYSIKNIESALVELFLENNHISKFKNLMINDVIRKSKEIEKIKYYFKEANFEFDLNSLERAFELLIPKNDRELNGAFYTPEFIVNYIVDKTIFGNQKVCDPSCGSGAFLLSATKKISSITKKSIIEVIENNIFGCDILDYNIRRTKILLTLFALQHGEDKKSIKFNFLVGDSLTLDWQSESSKMFKNKQWEKIFDINFGDMGFDAIIGNPPYVRIQDLEILSRDMLLKRWKTINGGNFNLYFAFFELGMKLLKKNGKLGFIVPNNYFTSFAAEKLREWLQENKLIEEIVDFTHLRIFKDAITYTCITILSKTRKNFFKYNFIDDYEDLRDLSKQEFDKVKFSNLKSKKWRLLKEDDFENVCKLESTGVPLGKLAQINSGIATLKDKLYFINAKDSKNNSFIKTNNGSSFLIKKSLTRKIIKISEMRSDQDVQQNNLRIIFPYKKMTDEFKILPENELKSNFPECYSYFESIKEELATRDKGKKKYPSWYAYGRGQAFDIVGEKLLTPTFSKKPNFLFDSGGALFCNGYAISNSKLDLKILQKILNSSIMDYYIHKTSVRIEGNFPCFQKNFIEMFTIPDFNKDEMKFLEKENNLQKIDKFLIKKYGLDLKPE